MSFTRKLTLSLSGDGAVLPSGIGFTAAGNAIIDVDVPLTNSATQPATLAIRASGLTLLVLYSDIAATVTFRDGGGTSVGSLALAAAVPYVWSSDGLVTNPISADVASINVSSAATGTLKIRGNQSATPSTATAALSGTLQSAHLESGIVTGGYTAILTLTGATWQPAGAAFNAQRQAIIDGFVSAQAEAAGWNAKRSNIAVSAVVRTSGTVVTITLPAIGSYDITVNETITATIPVAATTAEEPIVASPTVTITAGS